MSGTIISHWQIAYLCAALLVSVFAIIAGDHLRAGDPPAVSTRFAAALTAGALWPVIVVGLLQLWSIDRVVRHIRGVRTPQAPVPERTLMAAGSR